MTLVNARLDSATSTAASSLPRFILRKRSVSESDDGCDRDAELNLPTVTSAFLSGLFADVAQVVHEDTESDTVAAEFRPVKKSRVSLHRSMSRCGRSFKNLAAAASFFGNTADSPTGVADLVSDVNKCPLIPRLSKNDSLHFQLRCVVGGDGDCYSSESDQTVLEAGELAFPNLPNTVSNSSCSTLTRNLSDLQTSLAENNDKEAYGWFVAVDEDLVHEKDDQPSRLSAIPDAYASAAAAPTTDLAFIAPTAPHAINQDDEVEWAKAADMVDDVLGDFF
jgi:hypothetical protein